MSTQGRSSLPGWVTAPCNNATAIAYASVTRSREARIYFIIGGVAAAAGIVCVLVSALAYPPVPPKIDAADAHRQARTEAQHNALFGAGLALITSALLMLAFGGASFATSRSARHVIAELQHQGSVATAASTPPLLA